MVSPENNPSSPPPSSPPSSSPPVPADSKSASEIAEFVALGLPDGLYNSDRLTPEFKKNIVAPYATEEGKISLIRNASALNTNHTMMIAHRHKDIDLPTLILWGVHDPWQSINDGEKLAQLANKGEVNNKIKSSIEFPFYDDD